MEEILASIRNMIADEPAQANDVQSATAGADARAQDRLFRRLSSAWSATEFKGSGGGENSVGAGPRVDFDRDDAFIAPLALAHAMSVANRRRSEGCRLT